MHMHISSNLKRHRMTLTLPSGKKRAVQGMPAGRHGADEEEPQANGDLPCYVTNGGDNDHVIIYPTVHVDASSFSDNADGKISGEYLLARYDVAGVRSTSEGSVLDVTLCTVGGWKTNNGYQQLNSGVAVDAETDPANVPFLVTAKPGTNDGSTVHSNVTIGATWGAFSLSASLGALTSGSYSGDFGDYESAYADDAMAQNPVNEVNSWWEAGTLSPGTNNPVNEDEIAVYEVGDQQFNSAAFDWSSGLGYICYASCG